AWGNPTDLGKPGGPATPRKGPPKFKQRQTRQFKSKPPKKGTIPLSLYGNAPPLAVGGVVWGGVTLPQALSSLSSDITVICPWEAFSHLELHELAQYGII
uniref:3',5'-cyclic-GMP phosphodiesterase n=1 Tax=Geospiza parvula TaxID=87175 RepID=A0A8C3NGL8_GEOPR